MPGQRGQNAPVSQCQFRLMGCGIPNPAFVLLSQRQAPAGGRIAKHIGAPGNLQDLCHSSILKS
jgi:hypothetical protein